MGHSFNLTTRQWIPCLMNDGQQQDLSLFDALTRAAQVREIFDASPLVTVALHRLLLAVLHRNFGPADFKTWQTLWREGKWNESTLTVYLTKWQHRFNLFDEERPFYQVPLMEGAENHPAALLKQEAATGNNATLFDHSFKEYPLALSPAEAARYVVARQAFSIGGGVSAPFNFYGATLTRGISVLALGNNLFETLALNLIIYNDEKPFPIEDEDSPAWEQDPPAQPKKEGTPVRGYLDYLTWQSRRIHLIPEGEPAIVRHCQVQQNLRLPEEPAIYDPFKCYRLNKEKGFEPLPLSTTKALWRNSHTLFQQAANKDSETMRPQVFDLLARIKRTRDDDEIEARPAYAFAAYGFATEIGKAASVLMWARERLPLPLQYLDDNVLVMRLHEAISFADDVAETLRDAVRYLAKFLIAPESDLKGARQPDPEDVKKLAKSFNHEAFYWARLDTPFKSLLVALPEDKTSDVDGGSTYGARALPEWGQTLKQTAQRAFEDTERGLDSSGQNLKAAAKARAHFNRHLAGKMKEFSNR